MSSFNKTFESLKNGKRVFGKNQPCGGHEMDDNLYV